MGTLDGGTAGNRLRYNRRHTTALLADALWLLTGRNHHRHGRIIETPPVHGIQLSTLPDHVQAMLNNGYNTPSNTSPGLADQPGRPFECGPSGGGGFVNFYGFIGGEANQWYPSSGTTPVEVNRTPPRRVTISWRGHDRQAPSAGSTAERTLGPRPAVSVYFRPGLHVPHRSREWGRQGRGRSGWGALREEAAHENETKTRCA